MKLYRYVGYNSDCFVWAEQCHSSNARIVDSSHGGSGSLSDTNAIPATDALITQTHKLFISILTADCLPVLVLDPIQNSVAAMHAGRKGLCLGIIENTIQTMINNFHTNPSHLYIGIGPGIGSCCYSVDTQTADEFQRYTGILNSTDVIHHLNLQKACRKKLINCGVKPSHIESIPMCTSCQKHLFFSYRADHDNTGRFASFIALE